jgi:hypothetical protein
MVAEFVLQNAAQPAPDRGFASESLEVAHGGYKRLLHEVLGDVWIAHAHERVAVRAISVLLHPAARVKRRGRWRARAAYKGSCFGGPASGWPCDSPPASGRCVTQDGKTYEQMTGNLLETRHSGL